MTEHLVEAMRSVAAVRVLPAAMRLESVDASRTIALKTSTHVEGRTTSRRRMVRTMRRRQRSAGSRNETALVRETRDMLVAGGGGAAVHTARSSPGLKAIILCGMPAVGKTTVAKILASKLNLKLVGGGDILKEIALEQGYNAVGDDWWDTSEGMKFMQEREGSLEFDKEVDRRLISRAEKGGVVITSYTLPWLIKDGLKIWLSGTKESRAERMARRDASSADECAKIIDTRDRENYALYHKLYGIRFGEDLSPFTIVVGTDGVPAEKVAMTVLEQVPRPREYVALNRGARASIGRKKTGKEGQRHVPVKRTQRQKMRAVARTRRRLTH
jgi:cytidylate kinase